MKAPILDGAATQRDLAPSAEPPAVPARNARVGRGLRRDLARHPGRGRRPAPWAVTPR